MTIQNLGVGLYEQPCHTLGVVRSMEFGRNVRRVQHLMRVNSSSSSSGLLYCCVRGLQRQLTASSVGRYPEDNLTSRSISSDAMHLANILGSLSRSILEPSFSCAVRLASAANTIGHLSDVERCINKYTAVTCIS